MKKPLIIIGGPTASGKSDIGVRLAKAIGGEIISADSMQVYRRMDIGTAKVTAEEMDGVKHYGIDVLDPSEDFNVTFFKDMAENASNEIYKANFQMNYINEILLSPTIGGEKHFISELTLEQ